MGIKIIQRVFFLKKDSRKTSSKKHKFLSICHCFRNNLLTMVKNKGVIKNFDDFGRN